MTIKTLLAAAALTAVSAMSASAQCSWGKQAMSCADGMTYDSDSHACVPVSS
ncbi:hypothetical protein ATO8_01255 [Roseivivax marinus]|jgi:hypothetical protein|uniref:Chitin-binding type-2 domain-containing protein n=1 Tax=Roseivivax marinus TaxID=1379903 RepID=W4HP78_9RHOB|nr:adenylosuccinate lyase [Roseivivax marinus]ETW14494.1 hypothetical protein ATO8_01255 [Roseivivax marinus]UMA66271.1 adenylosuccinate lyase [Roseivivax marinus]SEL34175.1 hypothetical protein SAMN05444413_10828 [Roseivivax marinus]